jgi:hypothetical protein
MAPVRMFVEKFRGVVLIDEDHPLAVAQRAKDAVAPKAVISPVLVNEPKEIVAVAPEKPRRRGRSA